MDINQFHGDLVSDVRLNAEEMGTFIKVSFAYLAYEKLLSTEDLPDLDIAYFKDSGKRNKNVEIHGFGFDPADMSITLLITDFEDSLEIQRLTQTEVNSLVNRARGFFTDFVLADLGDQLEPSSEGARACSELVQYRNHVKSLRICVVSNRELSGTVKTVNAEAINDLEVKVQVWDLKRLYELEMSVSGRLPIEIDLDSFDADPIPALAIPSREELNVYLFAINGKLLAQIFDEWGSRLLESNVRSFLSVKTAVNKGIRETIQSAPEKFLPFNNGITATAEKVGLEFVEGVPVIKSLTGLQIVNGGQTTSSLYNFYKTDKGISLNLDEVYVQVKLIEVEPVRGDELVPLIARYANSQNKVAEADFFSNAPFHRSFEKLARETPAPPKNNGLIQTYWYYERARGQYNNEKSNSNKSWEDKNPPDQKFDKTDLAKFIMCWEGSPFLVSRGAQKNFVEFAKITHRLTPEQINATYFKRAVSLAILYGALRKRIMKSDWYKENSGYLANIVSYSISLLSSRLKDNGRTLNFLEIWNHQEVPPILLDELEELAKDIRSILVKSPNGMNVTEYAKNEDCWNAVLRIDWRVSESSLLHTVSLSEEFEIKQEAAVKARNINFIKLTSLVHDLDDSKWQEFETLVSFGDVITDAAVNTFKAMRRGELPNDKAMKMVPDSIARLESKGFSFGEI